MSAELKATFPEASEKKVGFSAAEEKSGEQGKLEVATEMLDL